MKIKATFGTTTHFGMIPTMGSTGTIQKTIIMVKTSRMLVKKLIRIPKLRPMKILVPRLKNTPIMIGQKKSKVTKKGFLERRQIAKVEELSGKAYG